MKANVWLAVEVLAAIALIVLLVLLIDRKLDDANYLKEQEALRNTLTIAEVQESASEQTPPLEASEHLSTLAKEKVIELQEKHPAVVGIINIPGTGIVNPIVQGKDNAFYLDHDKDGNAHAFGEVFLDSSNDPTFQDPHAIVYGHNVLSAKAIFYELLQYDNQAFYEGHRYIHLYTTQGLQTYEVIAVFRAAPEEAYRITQFTTSQDLQTFVDQYQERSVVRTKKPVTTRLLTLSTCFDDASRWVIQAMQI